MSRGMKTSLVIGVACSLCVAALANGQVFRARPVTLIVPLAAGSTADILARSISAELSKAWGQTVVVDNRPGGGATIGVAQAAKAAPDGYTLLMATNAAFAINVGLFSKLPYDPVKDFAPILAIATSSNVLIVSPGQPFKTPRDLIAEARAKPGQLTFSSGGNGTSHHLSGALLNAMAHIDTRHIPYKGAPQGVTAVITGEVTFGFFNTPNVVGLVKEGRARGLAVTSLQRSPLLPLLPTLSESGLPGYETTVSFGLVAPANTPAQIIERIHQDLVKVLAEAGLRERLVAQGYDLIPAGPPADYARRIKADIEKWVPIVKASGASID